MGWLTCGGSRIRYTVKYTGRKKTIGIRVTGRFEVEVLSPRGLGAARIEETLQRKGAWILRHAGTFKPPRPIEEGERIPYLGELVPIPARVLNAPADRRAALLKHYKKEAKRVVGERVEHWGGVMGLRPRKVLIKENRSSWGTCTPKNTLNFSYRLVMAPLPVVDYVVVHELAHLAHRGHTNAFWNTVSRYVPGVKEKRRWLREKGHLLRF
jgi:predicted metal-dependent hydrolase